MARQNETRSQEPSSQLHAFGDTGREAQDILTAHVGVGVALFHFVPLKKVLKREFVFRETRDV